mmetsp:Transcript_15307/g.35473  ORF Transcript_15307/g.35473 Transcript_15307/m.35473 type:complete len:236 (-) Transcript_15307:791-1498(-)
MVGRQDRNGTVTGQGLDDLQDRMARRVPDAGANGALPDSDDTVSLVVVVVVVVVDVFAFEDLQQPVVHPDVVAVLAAGVFVIDALGRASVPVSRERSKDRLAHGPVDLVLAAVVRESAAGDFAVPRPSRDLRVVDVPAQKEHRRRRRRRRRQPPAVSSAVVRPEQVPHPLLLPGKVTPPFHQRVGAPDLYAAQDDEELGGFFLLVRRGREEQLVFEPRPLLVSQNLGVLATTLAP